MAKQTFTTGQVLTAAQMTSLQQTAMGGGSATAKTASYVLVAADAGATVIMNAAGATTITVNQSLFSAGDTVFIQNTGAGISTITAGTATVNTASSLALAQYDSGSLYFTAAGASIFSKADGAAASGGSLTQLGSTTTLSGASTTVSFTATGYKNLYVQIDSVDGNGATKLDVEPNATNNIVDVVSQRAISGTYLSESAFDSFIRLIRDQIDGSDSLNAFSILIYDVASTTAYKTFTAVSGYKDDSLRRSIETMGGVIKTTSAISSLKFQGSGSGYSAGNVKVYGVN